jgi:DNA modification methylase
MPGQTVFSPFAGVGSEGYEALRLGRKFVGIELKRGYWELAQRHLRDMERSKSQVTMFDMLEAA